MRTRKVRRTVGAIAKLLCCACTAALIGVCVAPALASAQRPHPDLSGTWVLNLANSQLEAPAPDSTIFVIQDNEPTVRIFRTHARGSALDTVTIVLRTDSSQVDWTQRGIKLISRSWWDNAELLFWTGFADRARPGSQVVRYSLSADGTTFTAVERVDLPTVKHVNYWVFDRRS